MGIFFAIRTFFSIFFFALFRFEFAKKERGWSGRACVDGTCQYNFIHFKVYSKREIQPFLYYSQHAHLAVPEGLFSLLAMRIFRFSDGKFPSSAPKYSLLTYELYYMGVIESKHNIFSVLWERTKFPTYYH